MTKDFIQRERAQAHQELAALQGRKHPGRPAKDSEDSHSSVDQERRRALQELNMLRPRQVYDSIEERKKAAKKRSKKRYEERRTALEPFGLAPSKRRKSSPTERKTKRKTKEASKREFIRWAAKKHPEVAKEYGLSVKRLNAWGEIIKKRRRL